MSRQPRPDDAHASLPLAPHVFEILLSLSEREHHGYELVRDIRERTGGDVDLGTSTLYAALRRLLAAGWVEDIGEAAQEVASGGPPRRTYRITERGREVALLEARRVNRIARQSRRILGLAGPPAGQPNVTGKAR
jgi:DNA-binding PadR family transcriptional regulator